MLFDTHMHTCFSGDSTARPEDMILAARQKGLAGLCFTDHQDFDFQEEPGLFDLDLPAYAKTMLSLKKEASGTDFEVLFGIELGLQPSCVKRNTEVIRSYPFDFVIGSSHLVHGIDPYYPAYFAGRTERQGYQEYFDSILENLNYELDFDVYGHIDYIVRYGPNRNAFYTYRDYQDVIDEILKKLLAKGKGIEINTAGFKYGLGHPNPTEDVIRRYRELGGEIITIGADGHKPEHVAYDFEKVPDILKNAGFQYFTVFRNRKAEFHSLDC